MPDNWLSMRARNVLAVFVVGASLSVLSACSNGDSAEASPTIKDRAPASAKSTSIDDRSGAESSNGDDSTYENASDVIVDENGRRSFPAQTAEQTLDLYWNQLVASVDDDEIPERPDVDIVLVDDEQQFVSGYVSCMHNAGWTSVKVADGSIDSGEIPRGQEISYGLADYTCMAQNLLVPPAPMDESDIERLYDHQVDYVIPCLAERGHQVSNFPSKESFVDRYFAERTYTLATEMAGLSESERFDLVTEDPSVECHALPEGLWD